MSERNRVMNHLHKRIVEAWDAGNIDRAADLNAFLNGLESMNDQEYEDIYGDDFAQVGR